MIRFIAEKAVDLSSPEVVAGYIATAIIAVVGLLLTVFVLKKILYKPLGKMIRDRQHEVDHVFEEQEEREQILDEREQKLDEREKEQRVTLDQRRRDAEADLQKREDEVMADAREKANMRLAEANRMIEQQKKKEDERVHRRAVHLAVESMSRLADRILKDDEVKALDSTIRERLTASQEGKSES